MRAGRFSRKVRLGGWSRVAVRACSMVGHEDGRVWCKVCTFGCGVRRQASATTSGVLLEVGLGFRAKEAKSCQVGSRVERIYSYSSDLCVEKVEISRDRRAHRHDPSEAAALHVRHACLRHRERAARVDARDKIEFLDGCVDHLVPPERRRVVDQDVHTPPFVDCCLDAFAAPFGTTKIPAWPERRGQVWGKWVQVAALTVGMGAPPRRGPQPQRPR